MTFLEIKKKMMMKMNWEEVLTNFVENEYWAREFGDDERICWGFEVYSNIDLDIFGDSEGDVLIVGWGSSWGPIREAVIRAREGGQKYGAMHLRYLNPMPNSMEDLFSGFKHVVVVEMNDEGLYGQGQLATLLRSRFCDPKIKSVCKTDGLNFRVSEILERIETLIG